MLSARSNEPHRAISALIGKGISDEQRGARRWRYGRRRCAAAQSVVAVRPVRCGLGGCAIVRGRTRGYRGAAFADAADFVSFPGPFGPPCPGSSSRLSRSDLSARHRRRAALTQPCGHHTAGLDVADCCAAALEQPVGWIVWIHRLRVKRHGTGHDRRFSVSFPVPGRPPTHPRCG